MKSPGKVVYVSRKGFMLSDNRYFDHPWFLSEEWTIRQMQKVYDNCWQSFEIHHAETELAKHEGTDIIIPVWKDGMSRKDFEKELILNTLHQNHWVQKEAAKVLGISQKVLNYRIKVYGIRYGGWRVHKPGKKEKKDALEI